MSTRSRPPGHDDWRGAIRLPDRTWVRGRGVRYPLPDGDRPEFGLYLGVDYEPPWEHVWLDWPNHFLPRDHVVAARAIAEVSERVCDGQRVEVACLEGRGRTGTVMACLAVIAGIRPEHAVGWVRGHFNAKASRPPWQRDFVRRFPELLVRATRADVAGQ